MKIPIFVAKSQSQMAKQGTLLVVDDNRNILTSLQYLLEEYFQQVITLNSPVTIPSLLQREAIDVVLLDMNFFFRYQQRK